MKNSPKTSWGRSSLLAKFLQPDRSQAPAHSSQFAMHLSLFSVATFAAFLLSPTIILTHTKNSTATSSAPASTPSASLLVYTTLISAVKDKAKVERVGTSLPTTSFLPYLVNQLIFSPEAALLATFVQKVKANELDVLVFEVDVDRNRSQFLTYEVYAASPFLLVLRVKK